MKSERRPGPIWTNLVQRRPDKNPIFGIRPFLLLPGVLAYRERQLKTYFEKVYFLWFLIFPQTEEEIRVNKAFLDDPDYKKHIMVLWHKVGFFERLLVAVTDCLFPAGAWEDVLGICPLSENVSRGWPRHGWSNE